MKTTLFWVVIFIVILLVLISSFSSANPRHVQATTAKVQQADLASIVGPSQLSAARLNTILLAYHSPFAGEGQFVFESGRTYGISSDVALAFWLVETVEGTHGRGAALHNPGNLRCIKGYPCTADRFADMGSWENGIRQWYLLLSGSLYVGSGLVTVSQVVHRYAPNADHNTESSYSSTVQYCVQQWRKGEVRV